MSQLPTFHNILVEKIALRGCAVPFVLYWFFAIIVRSLYLNDGFCFENT